MDKIFNYVKKVNKIDINKGKDSDESSDASKVVSDKKNGNRADRRDGSFYYYYDEDLVTAVNVALVTSRPLLLSGVSGCGKSSLASNIAAQCGLKYYEYVVTSRTTARDLLWKFDAVRRLSDMTYNGNIEREMNKDKTGQKKISLERNVADKRTSEYAESLHRYIEPGIFWWAFNPVLAENRGRDQTQNRDIKAADPVLFKYMPTKEIKKIKGSSVETIILLDEIDKAEPDFPNDLLIPIGSLQFNVDELSGLTVKSFGNSKPPLIIITTNGERKLPKPFLRRCVAFEIEEPVRNDLFEIAINDNSDNDPDVCGKLADCITEKANVSIAEYLDLVNAVRELDIDVNDSGKLDEIIKIIQGVTVNKDLL